VVLIYAFITTDYGCYGQRIAYIHVTSRTVRAKRTAKIEQHRVPNCGRTRDDLVFRWNVHCRCVRCTLRTGSRGKAKNISFKICLRRIFAFLIPHHSKFQLRNLIEFPDVDEFSVFALEKKLHAFENRRILSKNVLFRVVFLRGKKNSTSVRVIYKPDNYVTTPFFILMINYRMI